MANEVETKPQVMPWQENYQPKANQPVPEPTLVEKAQGAVSQAVENVKAGKMPWDSSWKEKPVVRPSRALPADVRKAEPTDLQDYLTKTIGVESGGKADAKNPRSSATGLGQFIDSTWKEQVAMSGKNYTLEDRNDPTKAREILKDFTVRNQAKATQDLGRKPLNHELYLYHFLGSGAAGDFIKAPKDEPATSYVSAKAARDNRSIFYKAGKAKTVGEVIDFAKGKF